MPKKKTSTTRKITWRDYSDASHRTFTSRPGPESLCPTTSTIHRAISGDPTARIVIDSYAFRFPVRIVEVLECA